MTLLKRATDQQQSEWTPVPEGLWRWIVGEPELKLSEKYGKYQVRYPLSLTPTEKERLEAEHGEAPEGTQQSWIASYYTGLSLGYLKDGAYVTTKMIDFLAACLGSTNGKKFRGWVANGGGPPAPEDKDDQQAELENIGEWLKWWEGLEVYGTITHTYDKDGRLWARWAGPMAVGSLPGQKDDDYQAHGRGKLRAMLAEIDVANELVGAAAAKAPEKPSARAVLEEDLDDLPF